MYPSRFRYESPTSIDEAIALLEEGKGEAKVLAGGQSLVPMLKLRFASPDLLVDINNIADCARDLICERRICVDGKAIDN